MTFQVCALQLCCRGKVGWHVPALVGQREGESRHLTVMGCVGATVVAVKKYFSSSSPLGEIQTFWSKAESAFRKNVC